MPTDSARQDGELTDVDITDAMIDAGVRALRASGRLQHEVEGSDQELVAEVLSAALAEFRFAP